MNGFFMDFPIIQTEHLKLRAIQPEDAEAVYAFKSNIDVTGAYGKEPMPSVDAVRVWIDQIARAYEQDESIIWGITLPDNDRVVGTCLLWNFNGSRTTGEIGYDLHPEYWRHGIMSEATTAVLDYGYNALDLHRIEAVILSSNKASTRLIRKLGFKREGRLRQRHLFRGQFGDQVYFGLLREEWLQQTHNPG